MEAEIEKKDKGNRWGLPIAIIAILICVVIIILIVNSNPIQNPNGTDQNTTPDINKDEPQPILWCYKHFLHRRPVEKINIKEDDEPIRKISWQEAERLGYLIKGQELFMENISQWGTYCGGAVYYGWKKPYEDICLKYKDVNQMRMQECLDRQISSQK